MTTPLTDAQLAELDAPPSCLADAALLLRKADPEIAVQLDALIRSWRSPPSDGARGECTVCGHAGLLQTEDHHGPDGAICLGSGCLPKSAPSDGARDEEIERLKAEVERQAEMRQQWQDFCLRHPEILPPEPARAIGELRARALTAEDRTKAALSSAAESETALSIAVAGLEGVGRRFGVTPQEGQDMAAFIGAAGDAVSRALSAAESARRALAKINEIRNSIIGLQKVNWSEHVYPLVAALDEAGIQGEGYPASCERFGTMLERMVKAEDAAESARRVVERFADAWDKCWRLSDFAPTPAEMNAMHDAYDAARAFLAGERGGN